MAEPTASRLQSWNRGDLEQFVLKHLRTLGSLAMLSMSEVAPIRALCSICGIGPFATVGSALGSA